MNISSDPITRVIFFQVSANLEKLKRIVETAQTHFQKKEPFLILVEDERGAKFVDELLWKFPETSFLPHTLSDDSTHDWIAISKFKKNVNEAKFAFNLCSSPLFLDPPIRSIYEFEDLTAPSKKNLSSLRFDAYKKAGFFIEAR